MSPKKEELFKKITELQELNNNNVRMANKNQELHLKERKEYREEREKATRIIQDLRNEVAELKAELAKLATKQGTIPDENPAINNEPMPLGSPSTTNINVSLPPEVPTTQVIRKDKKVPAPEAITVYGVKDFNIFQQAILSNLTAVANLPVFNTLGNGSIKIKAACVDSYKANPESLEK